MQRYEAGIESLNRAYELGGRTSRLLGYLGHSHARAGHVDRARKCLRELNAREQQQYVPPYFPALILSGLEETDAALDRLEQAYAEGDTMQCDLKADPHWDRMAALPRFEGSMRKMAYPAPTKTVDAQA